MFFRRKKRSESEVSRDYVGVGRVPIPVKRRFEVLHRDGYTCQYCGAKGPQAGGSAELHIDHRIPVSAGGTNDVVNLVTACRDCNLGKGARRIDDGESPISNPLNHQWEVCRIDIQFTGDHRRQKFTIRADRYGAGKSHVIAKPREFNFSVALPPHRSSPMRWEEYRLLLPEKERGKVEKHKEEIVKKLKKDRWVQVSDQEFRRKVK